MNELERLAGLETDATAAVAAFRQRAAEEGLLDVAYAELDSPMGPLSVFVTRVGLVRLAYGRAEAELEDIAERFSPRIIAAPERTDAVRRELEEYLAGERRGFDAPVDWSLVRGFASAVLRATARIPFGGVSSYRQIATEAGSPNAYRAAGNALGSNPVPIVVPCHRVLHAGGGLGGYTGGIDRKRFLLRLEGVLGE